MIQRSIATWQELTWQEELKNLITDPEQLLSMLELDPSLLTDAKRAAELFPLRVTPSFISRMKKRDMNDPLLKQVMPLGVERVPSPGFHPDPLQETQANTIKGLIHKYHGRVLLISTTSCAINCRYCFRREFDYQSNRMSQQDWQAVFDYLRQHNNISEVIFSGGDPLMQSDSHFNWVITELSSIAHIERIRVHSRLPIVLPNRVTADLLDAFNSSRFKCVWVVHCNHANEIDARVGQTLKSIANSGITLLNQAVLLKGVNDTSDSQVALSQSLFECGTLPYYLHLLDKVSGAAHFDISESMAIQIHQKMAARLPGYLMPKLVKEEPGERAKTLVV